MDLCHVLHILLQVSTLNINTFINYIFFFIAVNGNVYNFSIQQPITSLNNQQILYPQQRVFHIQNSNIQNGILNSHSIQPTNYYMANSAPNYYPPLQLNSYPPTLTPQQTQPSIAMSSQMSQKLIEQPIVSKQNSIQVKRVLHSKAYVK